MERRSTPALLLAVTMLAAGCLGGGGPATDAPTTDGTPGTAPTTDRPTTGTGDTTTDPSDDGTTSTTTTRDAHDRWLRGDAVDVSAAEIARGTSEPLSDVDPEYRSLYRSVIENGSVVRTFLDGVPRGATARPVRVNGTYYAVERTIRSRETVDAHFVDLELRQDSRASDPIAFENLSAPARDAFLAVLPPQERLDDLAGFTRHCYYRFEDGTPPADAPVLDGEAHPVEYDGTVYYFTLDERTTTTRMEVEYSASVLAESTGEWQSMAIQRHVTNLSTADLDGKAREELVEAVETGSMNFHSPSPAVPAWVRTLRDWIRDNHYVAYRGELYELRIYFVME